MDRERKRNISVLALLAVISLALYLSYMHWEYETLGKGALTFFVLAVIFLLIRVLIDRLFSRRIRNKRTRYSFRKVISLSSMVLSIVAIIAIWIENTQAIVVAYGIIAAGIAISFQDLFKNLAGGLLVLYKGMYSVGDRVELGGVSGDVIDIDVLHTTLLETRGWVGGDQATGRMVMVPNGLVLTSLTFNYTKDHNFIWDEMVLPITFDSDWRKASDLIVDVVRKETSLVTGKATEEIERIGEKYYLPGRDVEPMVYVKITDNWIEFRVRFVTEARRRRDTFNRLSRRLLLELEGHPDIKLASATFDIVGFPDVRFKGMKRNRPVRPCRIL